MAGLHLVIAAILIGIGIYSVIATSRGDSAGCRGTCAHGDCGPRHCSDAPVSRPGPHLVRISPGEKRLAPAGPPLKSSKQVSTVRGL
jgi:hypothetical protein